MTKFQVGMLIFPGMTNLDFAGPFEVFARLPNTEVHVLSKSLAPVVSDVGGVVLPSKVVGEEPELDLVFVGGGPGINTLLEDKPILSFLGERGRSAKWVTSVCTGALVLGAAGLLRGYQAATHWTAMEVLRSFGAVPTDKRVVVDRNRITGGGVTAGIDFALTIAAILHGEEAAQAIQLGMEYNPEPPFRAGHPRVAPPEIVAAVTSRSAALTNERFKLARRIAEENGWDPDQSKSTNT